MVNWMADIIAKNIKKLKDENKTKILSKIKEGEKAFFAEYGIDVSGLALSYCLEVKEPVMVNDIPKVRIEIFNCLKDLLKNELAAIA